MLKGALLYGQSGGPSAVINCSALGVIDAAFEADCIDAVYACDHGISGILNDVLYDVSREDRKQLDLLMTTPSSAFGSVRYKLKNFEDDDTDYKRILEIFNKYNIRYFMYNGGNDSMDTCNKINRYMKQVGYDCRIVGVPKTIDNDLFGTDHCPGYGSAAKYVASSCMELYLDSTVYTSGSITIVEIMGRNAGWLTAASAAASNAGAGPDLIYLPEVPFDINKFVDDVNKVYQQKNNVFVAISEGIKDKDNKYISEYAFSDISADAFNHIQLGGAAQFLAKLIKSKIKTKIRAIEFSLLQRCAAHIASKTDADEAYTAGKTAVNCAVAGSSGVCIVLTRQSGKDYKCVFDVVELEKVANFERKVPAEYITKDGNNIEPAFMDYVLPLINGESRPPFENGLPQFAKLKKVKVK